MFSCKYDTINLLIYIYYAIGFDVDALHCHFIGLDPERVGLKNMEVPQLCELD